jgi:hypothetical protein
MTAMTRSPILVVLSFLAAACADGAPPPTAPAPSPSAVAPTRVAFEQTFGAWAYQPPGAEKDALALEVDRLAGQRYATVSRLYWHRDLDAARAAAEGSGRPILALRMLGKLDEDLSCANSRFFRVALYANRAVSDYLRDHFELVWTSERPVPVARIDFGDGRILERTVAGNSAHYVLDRNGRPVDVLPGLHAPDAFRAALERAEAVALKVAALSDDDHARAVQAFHRQRIAETSQVWASLGEIAIPAAGDSIMAAEVRAMSKAAIERPVVEVLALGRDLSLDDRRLADRASTTWAAVASKLPPVKLDDRSRALFAALSPADWTRAGQALPEAGVAELVASFEQVLAADSAFNQYYLHRMISGWFAAGQAPGDLAALNARVYGELFLTPASDPWLGMATPAAFTALPGDGVLLGTSAAPVARR